MRRRAETGGKRAPNFESSTDWLFQRSYAVQRWDNELALIRGELLCNHLHVCVCAGVMNIQTILSAVMSLRSCWLVVTRTQETLCARRHKLVIVLKYQWSCRWWKEPKQATGVHLPHQERRGQKLTIITDIMVHIILAVWFVLGGWIII